MKHAPEQYLIDFSSRTNDRCAKLFALRDLQLGISPGRLNGVVELLQRLTVLSRYLPEELSESYTVEAQVSAIASRIHSRHSVSEKTVRNWTTTTVELGCLAVDYRSQKFGGRAWNSYQINFASVLALLAGNGRKWPETVSDPRAVTVSAPLSVLDKCYETTAVAFKQQQDLQTLESCDRLVAEFDALEVYGAAELLGRASRKVGWDYLERLLRFYQSKPGSWGAGALRCRVQASQPGLPVERGWPPPNVKPSIAPELEPVPYVDTKLEEGLRHTRYFKLLRTKLGRIPEDHETEEALRQNAFD